MPGFLITETHYGPGHYQARHEHPDTRLIVTVRGEFLEDRGSRGYVCGAASALIRRAGEGHSNRYGPAGAVCLGVRFGAEWGSMLAGWGSDRIHESVNAGQSAAMLWDEIRGGASVSPIGMQCCVLDILARFRGLPRERERRAPRWVESTQELLRARLNAPPDVREAARLAGVHPAHLAREFRRFTGMTVGAYLRRQRVELACVRLQRRERTLAEIALEAGFCDQAHLSRVFRRHMGMSPGEFRRSAGAR